MTGTEHPQSLAITGLLSVNRIMPTPSDSLRGAYEMTTPFLEIDFKCSLKTGL